MSVRPDHVVDAFIGALTDAGVQLAALNFTAGDTAAGQRGLLSDPMRITEFRDNIDVCTGIAERTGCTILNALYGNRPGRDELASLNLMIAARAAAMVNATVVIEALNSYDNPRYPLTSSDLAFEVIDAARTDGSLNVAFLADLHHLARMGEDLPAMLTARQHDIAHIQIADVPGRGAPGTGTLDFPAIFQLLDAHNYAGRIGCEYFHNGTSSSPAPAFSWMLPERGPR
jgi:hydroxypyruvate isomerase